MTEAAILADEVLAVKASILLRELKTKVEVTFKVHVGSESAELGMKLDVVEAQAKVVYGEGFNEGTMGKVLKDRVAKKGNWGEGWAQAVRDLEGKLKRGQKGT